MNYVPNTVATANAVFYRSYSRKTGNERETWEKTTERTVPAIGNLGNLSAEEENELRQGMLSQTVMLSGRWLWIGGTPWSEKQENFSGAYNCTSTRVTDIDSFGLMMDLAMQGSGTGAMLEEKYISKLPPVTTRMNLIIENEPGKYTFRNDETTYEVIKESSETDKSLIFDVRITVGDSRQGWVDAYLRLLKLATATDNTDTITTVYVDLGNIRKAGEKLKGFGGTANPIKLADMFRKVAKVLNQAAGRQLTSLECCKLIDEAAACVVAGNIRRSAGMRQGGQYDQEFETAKDNLWQEVDGNWRIDPERDCLRMANHTRVFHTKPSYQEIEDSVRKQYYSGEGAIQFAPEAIARSNADLLKNKHQRESFIKAYTKGYGDDYLRSIDASISEEEIEHRLDRYGLNPCFAPGTMIMTRKGHFPIESLVGKTVDVWDGNQWVTIDNFRVTGENQPVYKITLHNGQTITATEYHKFILDSGERLELKDLKPGMKLMAHDVQVHGIHNEKAAYLKGFLVGDGTNRGDNPALDLYETKYCCEQRLIKSAKELDSAMCEGHTQTILVADCDFRDTANNRKTMRGLSGTHSDLIEWVDQKRKKFPMEVLNWDLPSKLEFIAGYMDADGTASDTENGFMYQVTSICKDFLSGFQLLLQTVGVKSCLRLCKSGGIKDFGKDRGGLCITQPLWRITISQKSSIELSKKCIFNRLKSFSDRVIKRDGRNNSSKIINIEFSHVADKVYCCTVPTNHSVSLSVSIVTAQCGEILGADFHCNLSEVHLNRLDPEDTQSQVIAFSRAALSVAALLKHEFKEERYQKSRELDPIVGVSFTGLFDFFVNAFGISWLAWWKNGRPDNNLGKKFKEMEKSYLTLWRNTVEATIKVYCQREGLKVPNRITTVQPAGSKSLLTGASPGWHPPKAQRYIRRITFAKNDPVALTYRDMGYSIVPSQSDKDDDGNLLTDPFDERCTEWLVEIPFAVAWADLEGADKIDVNQFSVVAQYDFYMQVQKHYTTHNTSATLEFRENEIGDLAALIHKSIHDDEGYISAALLSRTDAPFPRMPFEAIDKATYDRLQAEVLERKVTDDFHGTLATYDTPDVIPEGAAGCDSDKCLFPVAAK